MTWVVGQVVTADQLNNPVFTSVNGVFNIAASPFNAVAADSTASTTNAAAILAAYNAALAVGGGIVLIPPGEFYVDMGVLVFTTGGVILMGAGVSASRLRFVPTADNQIAIKFGQSGAFITEGGIRDLTIYSADTGETKTAISLLNTEKYTLRNVTIGYGGNNWRGDGDSIGLRLAGHNYTAIDEVFVYADKPVYFPYDAADTISGHGNDEYYFRHLQFVAFGNPHMEVENSAVVSSMTFDGTNDFAGGTGVFKMTGASSRATLMSFTNMRWEQAEAGSGFMFDLDGLGNQEIVFDNVSHAGDNGASGIKLRNSAWVTLKNYRGTAMGGNAAYDIDSTVTGFTVEIAAIASATPTVTVTGQTLVYDASSSDGTTIIRRIYQPSTYPLPTALAKFIGLGGAASASANTIKMYGTTSGSVTLAVAAVAGSNTLTLPAGTTDFSATGGTGQVVKQTSAGGAFTVATVAVGEISGFGTGVATWLATPSSANLAAAVTDETGSGALAFATSPTLVTPILGTPQSGTLTNCTGLPIGTGVSGLGTNVATALGINVGSAGAFVVNGGALGTPSSGTLTNCTGLPIGTGVSGLGSNVATFLATPSSANLASAVTGETGSGALVFDTDPTFSNAIGIGNYIQGQEVTEPSNPPSNQWRLYTVDSSGKTQLRVIFGTGGGIAIATEA